MSKNIQNETSNEVQSSSQKGYSLRLRTNPKKNSILDKLDYEAENDSFDNSHLKKSVIPQSILLPLQIFSNVLLMVVIKNFMIKQRFININ